MLVALPQKKSVYYLPSRVQQFTQRKNMILLIAFLPAHTAFHVGQRLLPNVSEVRFFHNLNLFKSLKSTAVRETERRTESPVFLE